MSEEVSALKSICEQFAAPMETEVRPSILEKATILNDTKQERRRAAGLFVATNTLVATRPSP